MGGGNQGINLVIYIKWVKRGYWTTKPSLIDSCVWLVCKWTPSDAKMMVGSPDGAILESAHQTYFKTSVCGASRLIFEYSTTLWLYENIVKNLSLTTKSCEL